MTQTQMAQPQAMDVELSFKRFILEQSSDYAHEPMADLYRVNLLAEMLNRYDEIIATGVTPRPAADRVRREYADIPRRMREQGFERGDRADANALRWPELTESEAADYLNESTQCQHKRTMGIAMCVGCLVPMMLLITLGELGVDFWGWRMMDDILQAFGVATMFGMIAMGVSSIVTAGKPKQEEKIRSGRFSLTGSLRKKLMHVREIMTQKSKKRISRGIGACIGSVIPVVIFAMLNEIGWSEGFVMLGVTGMFAMIAYGVYEMVMGGQERKPVEKLLK